MQFSLIAIMGRSGVDQAIMGKITGSVGKLNHKTQRGPGVSRPRVMR
jgi:hypothetical protein